MSKNKISLRALRDEDVKIFSLLANNKKIADNVRERFPHPYTESDGTFFINLKKNEDPLTVFAIEFDGQLCGAIGLECKEDIYKYTAEIGYWLGEPYWKKGIITEAIKQMVDYGFKTLKLMRIEAGVFEYNIGSMRALEKNGFFKEGIAQKSLIKNGKFWDAHIFAKINPDYFY